LAVSATINLEVPFSAGNHKMTIAYLSHPSFMAHDMGAGHPEQPARLSAISDQLIAAGLETALQHHDAPAANKMQLQRAHDGEYIDSLFSAAPSQGTVWLDGDTAMNPHTLQAALHAAGAAIRGVDLVMEGAAQQAFCAVRPPGHHAERNRAMGFCFFNNVVVGAAHALAHHGLSRVAIVDFDVHHGNGTEDIVADNDQILFCSTYQHPFYPHTAEVGRHKNVINCPLPAGAGGVEFRAAIEQQWLPALEQFKPELILISAGFDGHLLDNMAGLELLESDYEWVTQQLCRVAQRHAEGRVVSCLEGGYNLEALARSVVVHIRAFLTD